MEADQLGRLQDIFTAAQLIASYVQGVTEADFRTNTHKQDAIIRRLEIIGEAAVYLSDATRQAMPERPFRKNARHEKHRGARLRERGFENRVGSRHRACAGSLRGTGKVFSGPDSPQKSV
jgi:Protein of unknown function DUF86